MDAARCLRHIASAALCLLSSIVFSGVAGADELPNAPGWAFSEPGAEAAITLVSVLSVTSYALPQNETPWRPSSLRRRHEGYALASDLTGGPLGTMGQAYVGFGLEAGYYWHHRVTHPATRALRTSLVDLQAILLTTGITGAFKRATGRCRPRAFEEGRCSATKAEYNAFPSGHTALGSAVAGSHLALALRSEGGGAHRYVAFGISEAATIVTAVLRVLAGAHSWEDVLAGYAIGHTTGGALMFMHPMESVDRGDLSSESTSSSTPSAASFSWSGHF